MEKTKQQEPLVINLDMIAIYAGVGYTNGVRFTCYVLGFLLIAIRASTIQIEGASMVWLIPAVVASHIAIMVLDNVFSGYERAWWTAAIIAGSVTFGVSTSPIAALFSIVLATMLISSRLVDFQSLLESFRIPKRKRGSVDLYDDQVTRDRHRDQQQQDRQQHDQRQYVYEDERAGIAGRGLR